MDEVDPPLEELDDEELLELEDDELLLEDPPEEEHKFLSLHKQISLIQTELESRHCFVTIDVLVLIAGVGCKKVQSTAVPFEPSCPRTKFDNGEEVVFSQKQTSE